MYQKKIKIFSGRSNRAFAESVAAHLGLPMGNAAIQNFSDGEISGQYLESIRGCDVYVIQSTFPPGDNIMELLIMLDAAKRASANRVTAVIPYFGYARQDRKDQPRISIAAKLVANLLTTAGADRIVTMDLHAPQIQGFFDIPFDHLYSSAVFIPYFRQKKIPNLIVASPDVGGIKLARSFAKKLEADLVVVDKRRPRANVAEVMNIIGDVEGKNVLLVDDLVDTAGSLCNAAAALMEKGALSVQAAVAHPILSGAAIEKIDNSVLTKLYVTDSIPMRQACSRIQVMSVAEVFAEAIHRIYTDESISSLFE
ncbi:MAG: ribose-phosphate pyrophosphokinase [Bacteroidetes bacterium]|nr:ribose-phosphate pyrophosphokinase [Bacteroidota bacterium]